ncbi:MAG: S8 family serine peptidase [Syntrophomonadaceae bacterium]|nr:S8 family serine peptidase [Syntrophomonadaceae bacterium]
MKFVKRKRWQYFLSVFLCTCLLGQIFIYSAGANDRSADIIGSSPLLVPNYVTATGLSGKGQIVGIADSGLDQGSLTDIHPDLQSESGAMPRVVMLKSYTDRGLADDPVGHGTFMTGVIAGSGKASGGKYQGIAPGASIYFQALLDKNNNLRIPNNINDLFNPAYSAGVRIHVDGWGGGSNKYDFISAQIDKFVYWYPDFLPVFSAGNNGPNNGTLTAEANSKNALVIGSSQVPRPASDPESCFADQVAASSSRGLTGDGRIKPDLVAPGSSLISAKSSLTEGNFSANSFYTYMGGSSMATAVTGGALALLREQLNSQFNILSPSSALLKALLINGARFASGNIEEQGFGILDSSGTALALQEGTFKFMDEKSQLNQEDNLQYKFTVADPSLPVKVTLAWTDPPGTPGAASALVNNLDLIVRDSTGKVYYGNDFEGRGHSDKLNNVEQVYIKVPKAGEYSVTVRAAQINSSKGQDFALVYGQALTTGVITKLDNDQIYLDDGSSVNLQNLKLHQVIDGVLTNSADRLQIGSEVYQSSSSLYVFGETWQTGGIQALHVTDGDLLLEMNANVREGGYYLDPQAKAMEGSIIVNGIPVAGIDNIPTGSELKASVNPFLQTLWKLEAANQKVSGFIAEIDSVKQQLQLFKNDKIYRLAPWAAIAYQDQILDCSVQDLPYGSAEPNTLDQLMPGSKVTLQVSPNTGTVQSILVERRLVIGKVVNIDAKEQLITLDTGHTYKLFPGSAVYFNKDKADLTQIHPGDWVRAQLLSAENTIIQIQAYSRVDYGRVVYNSTQQNTLYIIDSNNQSRTYTINKNTEVYGSGILLETSAVNSGSWVRVISDPSNSAAWQVELAEVIEDNSKTISTIDPHNMTVTTTDGSKYQYTEFTRFSNGGYRVEPEDVTIGEKAQITVLRSPVPQSKVLAAVDVNIPVNVKLPDLQIIARSLNGVLIIQGNTSADRLYLYRQDGSQERIIPGEKGAISRIYGLLEGEQELQAVALNTATGAMVSRNIKITAYPIGAPVTSFSDIGGHWAEKYILDLARRNIVAGCGDGGFHPDQYLTRAELAVITARMQNLNFSVLPAPSVLNDYMDIPWWAMEAVLANQQAGLLSVYSDGKFKPSQVVTRSELNTLAARIEEREVINLFPGDALSPDRPITRAEAAAVLDQMLYNR